MQNDLRTRNTYFRHDSVWVYLKEYQAVIDSALDSILKEELELAYKLLKETKERRGRIFVGGNGGSAAIADHLNCDFTKGVYTEKHECFQIHSLVGSVALFSALANDVGYEHTFTEQLKMANLNTRDTVILISSSGNSPNIVEAAKLTAYLGASLIGFTGFEGGTLKALSDAKLHVDRNNYGIVEDCHQILMHVIAQYHYLTHA